MKIRGNIVKLLIILFFTSSHSLAQINFNNAKLIFGFKCFSDETGKQISCDVLIYKNDSLILSKQYADTSHCEIDLPLGNIYTCCFVKTGYSTKCIQFDLIKNISESVLSLSTEFRYRGAKIYLILIRDLPINIQSELSFTKPVALIAYNREKNYFDYDREYTQQIRERVGKTIDKLSLLNKNPELRKNFTDLNDTIKKKNDSILAKELILIKRNEELYLERLNLLEKQNLNVKLEKEKILKEALLNEEKALSLSKQKQLDLANQLRINQEQKAKELELIQQIEREQFLNQKKLNESEINEQKILAQSKQRELELANQERKTKQLEIENATYTKNTFLGLAVFIAIVSLLLLRAFLIKKKSNITLHKQNELIAEQKQEITDSIQYAQRIQFAILPTKENVAKAFPQSFVLFKPKDIVSGDFYWFQAVENKKYIAACDCTGHGVPGALMSMVATDMLNEALVHTKKVDEILAHTNRSIRVALKQSSDDDSTRDGMDLALCCFDDQTNILKYAGAYRPLWLIRHAEQDSASSTIAHDADFVSSQNVGSVGKIAAQGRNDAWELIEYKATKAAIGGLTEDNQVFQLNEIQLQKGDTIYLSSDGYADQFSPADKKLMTKRFKEILLSIQHLSMPEQEKYLEKFITDWRGNMEQTDDVLVIGVRV